MGRPFGEKLSCRLSAEFPTVAAGPDFYFLAAFSEEMRNVFIIRVLQDISSGREELKDDKL